MTSIQRTWAVIGAVLLLGLALAGLGFWGGYGAGKASVVCPTIKERVDTVTFAVLVHDTTFRSLPVTISRQAEPLIAELKPGSPLPTTKDTATCYTYSKTEPDGAQIKASVCSDSLPLHITGLQGDIDYIGPTVTTREIWTRDTVTIKVPHPTIAWHWPVVSFCVGVVAGIVIVETAKK